MRETRHMKKLLCAVAFSLLIIGNVFSTIPQASRSEIEETKAQRVDWYEIGGSGWNNSNPFNVKIALPCTSPSITVEFINGSLDAPATSPHAHPTSYENWYWVGQNGRWGFLWTEMPAGESTTQRGRGVLSVVYNDTNVVVLKRERNTTSPYQNHMITYYTFWKDKDYFTYEVYLERWNDEAIEQPQIGIYPGSGTYDSWLMGWNGTHQHSDTTDYISETVTWELMENQSSFYWQTDTRTSDNRTVGFIVTYMDPPVLYAGNVGASPELGELQYMNIYSTAYYHKFPPTRIFRNSFILYFYDADEDSYSEVYKPTELLAKELWQSSISKSQSWGDWDEWSQSYKQYNAMISNRISSFIWKRAGRFHLKNTTIGNSCPHGLMQVYADDSQTKPNIRLENDAGKYYITKNNEKYKSASNTWANDSTEINLVWRGAQSSPATWNWINWFYTWGDSDKFNITMMFHASADINVTKVFSAFRTRSSKYGKTVQFNEIAAGTTADWTWEDPYRPGKYVGILIKKMATENVSSLVWNSTGLFIYFVNNSAQQEYPNGWGSRIKLMVWPHYGRVTDEAQITGYNQSPTLADETQYFPRHALNSSFFVPYVDSNVFNHTATFPIIESIDSTHYNLTSIASGTKTFTIFLNTSVFTAISNVVGVTSYDYDTENGNLTFTGTWSGSKQIQIAVNQSHLNHWQMTFNHLDKDCTIIDSKITWQLYNGSQLLTYTEGQYTLLDGTYTLRTFYRGKLMNQTSLSTITYGNGTIDILMQMKPHTSVSNGYVAFNNTITSINIDTQTSSNLTFTVSGSNPCWIVIDVPKNASYVQRDSVDQSGWVYITSQKYIHLNATSLSTWEFIFPPAHSPSSSVPVVTYVIAIATVLIFIIGVYFLHREKRFPFSKSPSP